MTTYNTKQIDEIGAWLRSFKWSWFATLTFRKPVTANGARFVFEDYLKRVGGGVSHSPSAAWVIDSSPLSKELHIHSLIGNTGAMPARCSYSNCGGCGSHLWRAGFSDVKPYERDGNAAFYILGKLQNSNRSLDVYGNPIRADLEALAA